MYTLKHPDYVEQAPSTSGPTEKDYNDLLTWIRSQLSNPPKKMLYSELCVLVHKQFPGKFTDSEIMRLCESLKSDWQYKVAAVAAKAEVEVG